jgi:hypothetical protein
MVGDKQHFNEIKGFLSLQLELRLGLGFRLRLTKKYEYFTANSTSILLY